MWKGLPGLFLAGYILVVIFSGYGYLYPFLSAPPFLAWLYFLINGHKKKVKDIEKKGYKYVSTVHAPYGTKALRDYEASKVKT